MAMGIMVSASPYTSIPIRRLHMASVRRQENLGMTSPQGETLPSAHTVHVGLLVSPSSRLTTADLVPGERGIDGPLTTRELDVLRLVAEGLTSKEIGRELFLSPKTVNTHLTSIFNKLAVGSRAHAVAVAARQGYLWERRPSF